MPSAGFRIALLAAVLALAQGLPSADSAGMDVAVVMSQDIAPYREAIEGLKSDPGLRLTFFDIKGDVKEGPFVVRQIRALHPDAVLTVGSLASEVIGGQISDIPVVFCMTTSVPESAAKSSNISGVTLAIPPGVQFDALRRTVPSLRSIGVIYDPGESADTIRGAEEAARARGLVLVTRPISNPNEIPAALRSLVKEADALWLIPDPTCFTRESFMYALKLSIENRVPMMVFAEAHVKAGALLSLSADYAGVGRQAAALLRRSATGQRSRTPLVESPAEPVLVLNRRTAKNLDIEIPETVLASAGRLVH